MHEGQRDLDERFFFFFFGILLAAMERIHPKGVGAPSYIVVTLYCHYKSVVPGE
jgi:hypothetical protein